MRTLDLIKCWLSRPAQPVQASPRSVAPNGPVRSSHDPSTTAEKPLSRPRLQLVPTPGATAYCTESPRSPDAQAVSFHQGGFRKGSPGPADSIERDLIECLKPVDWASVSTLARLTGVAFEDVVRHLRRLEQMGKVRMGRRCIPPESRTIAWLVRGKEEDHSPTYANPGIGGAR